METFAIATPKEELQRLWLDSYELNLETKRIIEELRPLYGVYYLSDNDLNSIYTLQDQLVYDLCHYIIPQ